MSRDQLLDQLHDAVSAMDDDELRALTRVLNPHILREQVQAAAGELSDKPTPESLELFRVAVLDLVRPEPAPPQPSIPFSFSKAPFSYDPKYFAVYCDDKTGSIVARVGGLGFNLAPRTDEERHANGRLFAAAPHLYATCLETRDLIDEAWTAGVTLPHTLLLRVNALRQTAERVIELASKGTP